MDEELDALWMQPDSSIRGTGNDNNKTADVEKRWHITTLSNTSNTAASRNVRKSCMKR